MTSDAAAANTSDLAAAPSVLPAGVRTRILIYLGVLLVLLGFGSPGGGLIGLPISFLLKNKLHLEAHEMAIFSLIAGVPSCVSGILPIARARVRGGVLVRGSVDQGAIADNKRLGAVLAMIRNQQLRRGSEGRSGPRRHDQRDARLFKVG
jgi:hypothetical protein